MLADYDLNSPPLSSLPPPFAGFEDYDLLTEEKRTQRMKSQGYTLDTFLPYPLSPMSQTIFHPASSNPSQIDASIENNTSCSPIPHFSPDTLPPTERSCPISAPRPLTTSPFSTQTPLPASQPTSRPSVATSPPTTSPQAPLQAAKLLPKVPKGCKSKKRKRTRVESEPTAPLPDTWYIPITSKIFQGSEQKDTQRRLLILYYGQSHPHQPFTIKDVLIHNKMSTKKMEGAVAFSGAMGKHRLKKHLPGFIDKHDSPMLVRYIEARGKVAKFCYLPEAKTMGNEKAAKQRRTQGTVTSSSPSPLPSSTFLSNRHAHAHQQAHQQAPQQHFNPPESVYPSHPHQQSVLQPSMHDVAQQAGLRPGQFAALVARAVHAAEQAQYRHAEKEYQATLQDTAPSAGLPPLESLECLESLESMDY